MTNVDCKLGVIQPRGSGLEGNPYQPALIRKVKLKIYKKLVIGFSEVEDMRFQETG